MLVRVSAISYLNTMPFVYGLENHPVSEQIKLEFCTPGEAADNLIRGHTDIGIVPVAIIPSLKGAQVFSDFCIGAEGKVASVLLCSGKPLSEIEDLYLDVESRTSVLLARILCNQYWKIQPRYTNYTFSNQSIDINKSYILIGDKAIINSSKFEYVYDLAEEWVKFRNKPFVFACWTSNRELDPIFIDQFNQALNFGIENIDKAVEMYPCGFSKEFALNYLKNNISYTFNSDKRAGLSDFWSLALEELKSKVRWFG